MKRLLLCTTRVAVGTAAFCVCQLALWGQGTGEIAGRILEADGQPSPFAHIVATQPSGFRIALDADLSGSYRFAGLSVGRYQVSAKSVRTPGSASVSVDVNEGEKAKISLSLTPGWATLDVQVLPETPLSTDNFLDAMGNGSEITRGETGGTIEGYGPWSPRGNLALNSVGLRGQNNNFLIDGMDNNDAWLRGPVLDSSIETIETAALMAPYLSADLGHAAAASIEVMTRSGAAHLHGSAFESLRNSALDARNFFDGLNKPRTNDNRFGGALSGPVKGNDWFFFLSAEIARQDDGLTVRSTVPTPAMKAGIFAEPIYDPLTIVQVTSIQFSRQPFAGNKIPLSRVSPQAMTLLGLYPNPNLPGQANNYWYAPSAHNDGERYAARTDKIFSPRHKIFGRLNYERQHNDSPSSLPSSVGSDPVQQADNADISLTAMGLALADTFVWRPSVINEFKAGYTRLDLTGTPADQSLNTSVALSIPGLGSGLPVVSLEGYAQLGAAEGVPVRMRTATYELDDNVRWSSRRHNFEFGAQALRRQVDGDASEWTSRGTYLFTPDYTSQQGVSDTGNPIASLILGDPAEVRRDVQLQPYKLRGLELAVFAQDEIRFGHNLTIQAGLRYSFDPPVTEADNRMVNFNYDRIAPALNQFAGQNGVNSYGGLGFKKLTIAPRIGFAWLIGDSGATVLRGGFTQGYDPGAYMTEGALARNPPYASRLDLYNGTLQLGPGLAAGLPAPASLTTLNSTGLDAAQAPIYAIEPHGYTPYADEWGLFLQRRLTTNLTAELSGSSSMGIHLYESFDANEPYPAPTPYNYPRYPYGALSTRIEYLGFGGGSTYYGGQAKLTGQLGNRFHILATYRYAKALDDSTDPDTSQESRPSTPQFIYNLRGIRSAAPFDIPQRLVITGSWELPFERHAGGLSFRSILADWRLSTVVTAQSGFPFTPQLAVNNLNNGGIQLPDRVGSGALPASQRSAALWFNTSLNPADPATAFLQPALFQYGNSGFDILRGPGLATVDGGLSRTFAPKEKMHLQVRFEAFNLLNRTNLGLPNRLLGLESSGSISYTATPARQGRVSVRIDW